jgi:cytochrome P450
VEELLRAYPPVPGLGRTVASDHKVEDQLLKRGDRVWLYYASANRDEQVFEEPDEIRLARAPNPHATFGLGIHRCVGSNVARAEIRIVLDAILQRMGDYEIVESGVSRFEIVGAIDGYFSLPATFTPGHRSGGA